MSKLIERLKENSENKKENSSNEKTSILAQLIENLRQNREDKKEQNNNNNNNSNNNTNTNSNNTPISISTPTTIGSGYNAYYRMLSAREKTVYRYLYNKKSKFIAGNDISLGLGTYSVDEVISALSALRYDYPEFYYLTSTANSYTYAYSGSRSKCTKLISSSSKNNLATYSAIKAKADTVILVAKTKVGDYNKIKYVHDWLCDNMYYTHNNASINGFILNSGQCMTYAHMFQYIMNELNIDCIYVISTDGSHAWNRVKVGGRWYMIDVCWDDDGGGYNYFLKGKSTEQYSVRNDSSFPTMSTSDYK